MDYPKRWTKRSLRRDTRPEQIHRDIYRVLHVAERIMLPIKRWTQNRVLRCFVWVTELSHGWDS
jgi:hypothetical protein